jgi:hypothetical protein
LVGTEGRWRKSRGIRIVSIGHQFRLALQAFRPARMLYSMLHANPPVPHRRGRRPGGGDRAAGRTRRRNKEGRRMPARRRVQQKHTRERRDSSGQETGPHRAAPHPTSRALSLRGAPYYTRAGPLRRVLIFRILSFTQGCSGWRPRPRPRPRPPRRVRRRHCHCRICATWIVCRTSDLGSQTCPPCHRPGGRSLFLLFFIINQTEAEFSAPGELFSPHSCSSASTMDVTSSWRALR